MYNSVMRTILIAVRFRQKRFIAPQPGKESGSSRALCFFFFFSSSFFFFFFQIPSATAIEKKTTGLPLPRKSLRKEAPLRRSATPDAESHPVPVRRNPVDGWAELSWAAAAKGSSARWRGKYVRNALFCGRQLKQGGRSQQSNGQRIDPDAVLVVLRSQSRLRRWRCRDRRRMPKNRRTGRFYGEGQPHCEDTGGNLLRSSFTTRAAAYKEGNDSRRTLASSTGCRELLQRRGRSGRTHFSDGTDRWVIRAFLPRRSAAPGAKEPAVVRGLYSANDLRRATHRHATPTKPTIKLAAEPCTLHTLFVAVAMPP